MSTWYKVSTSGTLYGRIELPDEFEQYIRRLEAERDEALRDRDELVVMVKKAQEERDYNKNTAMNNAQAAVSWMDKSTKLEAERDEATKAAKEWGDLWRKMNDLRVRATMERDEARRWAIHYRRLYEATQKAAPFVPDEVHITRQSKRSKGGSKNG